MFQTDRRLFVNTRTKSCKILLFTGVLPSWWNLCVLFWEAPSRMITNELMATIQIYRQFKENSSAGRDVNFARTSTLIFTNLARNYCRRSDARQHCPRSWKQCLPLHCWSTSQACHIWRSSSLQLKCTKNATDYKHITTLNIIGSMKCNSVHALLV